MRTNSLRRGAMIVGVALAFSLGFTQGADAQGDRASLQAAREAMEAGQVHYAAGRFEQAAESFIQAYNSRPFSAFLYNAAVAFEHHQDYAQAAAYYQRYLDAEPAAADAEQVRAKIAALQAMVEQAAQAAQQPDGQTPDGQTPDGQTPDGQQPDGQQPDGQQPDGQQPDTQQTPPVQPPPPAEEIKSLLSIQTDPVGATVSVYQGLVMIAQGITGEEGFDQTLDEGDYRITIEHPDYRTVEETVHLGQGRVYVVIVEMSQGQFLGFLRVVTDPPEADVYVDDISEGAVGRTPYSNVIATGTHTIWVERPGYQRVERQVTVELGEDVEVRVDLERVPYGRVRITGNIGGAHVVVDGERVGEVPYEGDVPAGEHRIAVVADGMKHWVQEINIQAGQIIPIQVRLRPSVNRGGAWATATIGLLTIGGGVALAMLANGLETDLEQARVNGTLASDDPRLLRGRLYAIGANTAFGLGALLGLLSIYYFVRDPLPDSEAQVFEPRDWSVIPQLDVRTRSAGAQLNVRF